MPARFPTPRLPFESAPLRGLSVLVVDDNADARQIFTLVLRQAGAVVSAVGSAAAATRRLKHLDPDIVMTDLSMPRRDGVWLLQWIRTRDERRKTHTPVIAVTARDDLYDVNDLRFDSCLVKPVPWGALLASLLAITARDAAASV